MHGDRLEPLDEISIVRKNRRTHQKSNFIAIAIVKNGITYSKLRRLAP